MVSDHLAGGGRGGTGDVHPRGPELWECRGVLNGWMGDATDWLSENLDLTLR